MAGATASCVFCAIATNTISNNTVLHSFRDLKLQDDKVVAFQDIRPSAFRLMQNFNLLISLLTNFSFVTNLNLETFRHYLVIPVAHIPTVKDLKRKTDDYSLVCHMLEVGRMLLHRDAPQALQYRFGFHQPPLNTVDHLHLHCLALPFTPRYFFIFMVTVYLDLSCILHGWLNLILCEL
ncbi:Bifunctional adenosine 5'-phosphosulfate phosphorylase/adenylylsulfatase HINT4, partial [Mucuna pruriens]